MKPKHTPKSLAAWLARTEQLIAAHSTPARTRGKYKGHGSTDTCAWVDQLSREVRRDIARANRGIGYDENLAQAAKLGQILVTWYALCHRAKAHDPNRPLKLRRRALKRCAQYRIGVAFSMSDDALMVDTWGAQLFNLPYGRGAIDGTFV